MKTKFITTIIALAFGLSVHANVVFSTEAGWLETAYAEFTMPGYTNCNAYVKPVDGSYMQLDQELIRQYSDHWRVDALGLSAGSYSLKVVPVDVSGNEVTAAQAETGILTVQAHDRHGFAHLNRGTNTAGIGAYNDNGTLKSGARVLYLTASNCKTVQLSMRVDNKGKEEVRTGLQHILQAYEKGAENRPLTIRILGCIPEAAVDSFGSLEEGLQIKGGDPYMPIYLTVEGVGNDAAIHGFGILNRQVAFVEYRNFAIMNCWDDCLGFDTKNSNCWVHNLDFFYGKAGSAADQVKGDGTVDIKALSKDITVSYNHFFDSGKSSLCGMKSETTDCYITYHHNWFDHSDSRHPRIRTMSVHIYNNYYDGNSKYGVGMTYGGSAFVEANYFKNCKHPMLTSMQGTDAQGDGTFSGETGGIIKACNNTTVGSGSVIYRTASNTTASFDAYQVSNRTEQVPATVVSVSGNTAYNNFDQSVLSCITPDDPAQVPTIVTGACGAGRCQKGNISYTFSTAENTNYGVIDALKTTVTDYASSPAANDLQIVLGIGEASYTPEPEPETPMSGSWECYWDNEGNKWSSNRYTIVGNTVKKTQSIILLDNSTVDANFALKMESSTSVKFTAPSACSLKLVFQSDQDANIKIDGTKKTNTGNEMTMALTAGAHEITKGDSRNLFYWALMGVSEEPAALHTTQYGVTATKVLENGQLYILRNGHKYTASGILIY